MLEKLPVVGLDDVNHRRRAREVLNQVLDHSFDDSRAQTSAEKQAGVTPVNKAYPPGDVRRYGATDGTDCTTAIQNSLASAGIAEIPENFTAKVSSAINMAGSGWVLKGKSRYTSIIRVADGFTGSVVKFAGSGSGTCYGINVQDIRFQLYDSSNTNLDIVGVDLSSVNNATVRRCRFEGVFSNDGTGDDNFANYLASGVLFNAPISAGAYSNTVRDCDFTYLEHGVLYGNGANGNKVKDCEILHCKFGVHAAPSSSVDSVYVEGCRIEANDVGIIEGSSDATYIRNRFEDNESADIEFTASSSNVIVLGGSTATSPTVLKNLGLAVGSPVIIAPDLYGVLSKMASDTVANQFYGPNVVTPRGNGGSALLPTGISDVALYGRGGKFVLDNNNAYSGRNNAGTGGFELIKSDTSDRVQIDPGGQGTRFGGSLSALGGGAAATLGTIGGAGPGTAAQNSWKLFFDSGGNAFFVPVWK